MKPSRPRRKEEQLDLFAEIDPPAKAGATERRSHMAPDGLCGECFIDVGSPTGCTSTHSPATPPAQPA
jgi:hypothetical protein